MGESHPIAEIIMKDTSFGIKEWKPQQYFPSILLHQNGSGQDLDLGFSVSYGIFKKYNGEILIKNLEGTGCELITLPVNENK